MRLYIKNMVCNRCVIAVEDILQKNGIAYRDVRLGEAETINDLTAAEMKTVSAQLTALGFEVLDDAKKQLIEKIKTTVIEHIHYSDEDKHIKFSAILSKKLHKDYSYLSSLFSSVEGITIEKYIINQKIEKAKELLIYDELNLSEIAFRLGYSSVAHLSNQFKKVTGLTPSNFKQFGKGNRKPLDQV